MLQHRCTGRARVIGQPASEGRRVDDAVTGHQHPSGESRSQLGLQPAELVGIDQRCLGPGGDVRGLLFSRQVELARVLGDPQRTAGITFNADRQLGREGIEE